MIVSHEEFEKYVAEAVDALPENFQKKINNLVFFVEDYPSNIQLQKYSKDKNNKFSLFGLFEGYVQSRRQNFGAVLPDKITIFRVPIMQSCSDVDELKKRITNVVNHEIAHHFGSDEVGARQVEKK